MSQIKYQWNGTTKYGTYSKDYESTVQTMFKKLKSCDWDSVIEIASRDIGLVNCIRPGSDSWYTILHGAARGGASHEVVKKIIELGAFLTMKTSNGETASDLAQKFGHDDLIPLLTPKFCFEIDQNALKSMESNFHSLIRKKTEDLISKHSLRLPDLNILIEIPQNEKIYYPIPGMMGGVLFSFKIKDKRAFLNVQIESRMWGGADYYEVSEDGFHLLRSDS